MVSFSIVVPVYNVAPYLETCLQSIAAQSCQDFEAILVNDGSTDGSGLICDEFAERDIRFKVIHNKNQGVSRARNEGLSRSKGRYVYIMDSDDWLHPEMLQHVYEKLHQYPYDVFVFGMTKHRQHKHSASYSNYVPPYTDIRDELSKRELTRIFAAGCGYSHWTSVFRREFLETHCIEFEQIKRNEDMNFMLDVFFHAQSILAIDRPFYNYRIFSAVHKFNEYAIENHAQLFAKFHSLLNRFCQTGTTYPMLRVFLTWFMHSVPTNFVRSPQLSRSEKVQYLREIYHNDTIYKYSKILRYSESVKLNLLFFLFRLRSPWLLYFITRLRFFVSNVAPVNIRN